MELRRYARLIARRAVLIVVCALVGAAVGYLVTSRTPTYQATATIFVGSRAIRNDPQEIYNELGVAQIANTFATMIRDPGLARSAIQTAGVVRDPYQVAANTNAAVVPNTTLILVTVRDPDPVVAERLVNATVNAFTARTQNFNGAATGKPGDLPAEPAYAYREATTPGTPLSSGAVNHAILGGVFGTLLAVLVVLLIDYLDVTARNPEELERRSGLMVLGTIPLGPSNPPVIATGRPSLGRGST